MLTPNEEQMAEVIAMITMAEISLSIDPTNEEVIEALNYFNDVLNQLKGE